MVKIQMEVCKCDYCGLIALTLPECFICGKHLCEKHQRKIDVGMFTTREKDGKLQTVFKEAAIICIECSKNREEVYTKLSVLLSEKAAEVPEEIGEPKI